MAVISLWYFDALFPLYRTAPTDDIADIDIVAAHKAANNFLKILIFILNTTPFL